MARFKSYIVKKLKEGDIHIFEEIYNEHYHALCSYAQRFVFNSEDTREIVQDVFVKIWEIRETLPGDINFKTYLYTAVRNRCLDYLKHLKITNSYKATLLRQVSENMQNGTNASETPLEGLITKDLEKSITDAVEALPDKCREVFMLSRFEGMKYKEIAEKLNISVNTVETHMSRAIKALRKSLSGHIFKK